VVDEARHADDDRRRAEDAQRAVVAAASEREQREPREDVPEIRPGVGGLHDDRAELRFAPADVGKPEGGERLPGAAGLER
jgi:hypothetical protein